MMFVALVVLVVAGNFAIFNAMMMEAKEPLDEKHRHQTGQHPKHERQFDSLVFGYADACLFKGMGQHVQQADAKHHASHKADCDLHATMRQANPHRNHAASNRGTEDQQAVISEEYKRAHREFRV